MEVDTIESYRLIIFWFVSMLYLYRILYYLCETIVPGKNSWRTLQRVNFFWKVFPQTKNNQLLHCVCFCIESVQFEELGAHKGWVKWIIVKSIYFQNRPISYLSNRTCTYAHQLYTSTLFRFGFSKILRYLFVSISPTQIYSANSMFWSEYCNKTQ